MLNQRIERQLEASSLGALPVSELLARLREEPFAPAPDLQSLLAELGRWPERFRIVDPWQTNAPFGQPSSAGARERGLSRWKAPPPVPHLGSWAVLLSAVRSEHEERSGPQQLATRLRDSIQHLARVLDIESLLAVARWSRLAASGRETDDRLSPA